MIIVQGDNGTVINEVFKKNGVAVDLTGATVLVYVKIGETMFTKNVTITDAVNGEYDLTLNSNDVGITGLYYYQAVATFTGGKRISSDIDRFIVTKRLDGIPVDPGTPDDGGGGEIPSELSRLGISANGKLTIDGVEQTGGGSGGSLTYATLADLQTAYPNGTTQPVWVVAENSWYYWSGEITEPTPDTTAPNEVTGLTKTNVTQTGLTLSWTASTSSDIASYEIYNGTTLLTTVTGTTYNVTGLTASTAYTFTVKAKDSTGNVSTGVQTSVTTLAEPIPNDTTAPNNVTNLAYTNVTATGVTLTWTASTSTDVANYQIYRDGVNIGQASVNEFIITGLTASTAYQFTVKTKDTSANEASGVSVNVTTSAPADTTAPVLMITPAATFTDTQQVTMSTNETATIYYTLDGSTPTTASSVYSTALTLSATTTVKAFARDTAGNSSAVQTVVYTKEDTNYIVFDDFNRANNTTSLGTAVTGQTWANYLATSGIIDNQAYNPGTGTNAENIVDAGIANTSIEADFVYGSYIGIVARHVDSNNLIVARISSAGLGLFKFIGGTATALGSAYTFTPVNGTVYNLKVVVNGSTLTVYLDGALRISATDSYNSTATKHGFRIANTSHGTRADNFKIRAV